MRLLAVEVAERKGLSAAQITQLHGGSSTLINDQGQDRAVPTHGWIGLLTLHEATWSSACIRATSLDGKEKPNGNDAACAEAGNGSDATHDAFALVAFSRRSVSCCRVGGSYGVPDDLPRCCRSRVVWTGNGPYERTGLLRTLRGHCGRMGRRRRLPVLGAWVCLGEFPLGTPNGLLLGCCQGGACLLRFCWR